MKDMPTNWKNISVFLDDTPQGEKVADHAAALAQRFQAHLIGIHNIDGIPGELPTDSFVRGEQAMDDVIARYRAAEKAQATAVACRFATLSRKYDIRAEFRVIRWGHGEEEALINSLHCDLVVLGHPKSHGLPESWSAERLLIASGVPILFIPDDWSGKTVGSKVLVAWNGSREARRAIADALPALCAAQSVCVLVIDPARTPEKYGENPGADIAVHLTRHGVRVDVHQMESNGAPIVDIIRYRAVVQGADLIVIGAYSHARSAEMIFGGVTRSLLAYMPIPTLVSR